MISDPLLLSVTESRLVGEARRAATALAAAQGLGETERGRVALAVTEMATNLVKHAREGELILRSLPSASSGGVEILSVDRGPGMANVEQCLSDGFSTGGSRGQGLGAVHRLSSTFDIHSVPGAGTVIVARLRVGAAPPPRGTGGGFEIGVVCLPKGGEEVSGDSWAFEHQPDHGVILVVDGLGHGPDAADAAREAVRLFRQNAGQAPQRILEAIHAGLRGTRGAAAAVAEIDTQARQVRYAGVGNISSAILSRDGQRHSLVSHNGIVGHQARKIQEFLYPWPGGSLLVMHSDGVSAQWRPDRYPDLPLRDPSLLAAVLYRDHARGRDDVTVLVAREAAETAPSL
jgi:anti-sigma regulatory factor (Ser/Thr protein kinase)